MVVTAPAHDGACDSVMPCGLDGHERWIVLGARVHGDRAARSEATARRELKRTRWFTDERRRPGPTRRDQARGSGDQ